MRRRVTPRKAISRPRIGTPRVKWLKKLEQEEGLRATTRFTERNIGIYYKTAIGKFFIKE